MTLPLRPNICILLFNEKYELLLGERSGNSGIWQFPQGGIEDGASYEDSALRELSEELGSSEESFEFIKLLEATNDYDFSNPPPYAEGVWRGQSQRFALVKFLGSDSDLNVEASCGEFSAFKWVPHSAVLELTEKKRRRGYTAPIAEFNKYIESR